jgi:hypothetical protein
MFQYSIDAGKYWKTLSSVFAWSVGFLAQALTGDSIRVS